MIHQYKGFVGTSTYCAVEWEGKSTLAPADSTVYLQIYNYTDSAWETVDTNSSAPVDANFELYAKIPDLSDYASGGLIAIRVYQFATE